MWLLIASMLLVGLSISYRFAPDANSVPRDSSAARPAVSTARSDVRIGRASVVDGDTIDIAGERIRFNGIDAPESNQTCRDEAGKTYRCGAVSAAFLDRFLAKARPVRCEFVEWDQYGRFVGDCYLSDGRNVNAAMVREGHAVDWPRYSAGKYAAEQETAKREGKGLWRGDFEMPWEFRAAARKAPPTAILPLVSNTGKTKCNIKGNISSKGERIYHLPGQMHYDKTRISTSRGERWFCSESEARAAGWRRARQ